MKKGYDILATFSLVVRKVTNRRVVRLTGTGKDKYVPNAEGRAHHCKWGGYDYLSTLVAQ